jgi:hypothetical protein
MEVLHVVAKDGTGREAKRGSPFSRSPGSTSQAGPGVLAGHPKRRRAAPEGRQPQDGFGEFIDRRADWEIKKAMRECDLFIAAGTSGAVSPANRLVRTARIAGAMTIYINLEPLVDPGEESFLRTILGKAEEVLPTIFGEK